MTNEIKREIREISELEKDKIFLNIEAVSLNDESFTIEDLKLKLVAEDDPLPDEGWRYLYFEKTNEKYLVSNFGRVKFFVKNDWVDVNYQKTEEYKNNDFNAEVNGYSGKYYLVPQQLKDGTWKLDKSAFIKKYQISNKDLQIDQGTEIYRMVANTWLEKPNKPDGVDCKNCDYCYCYAVHHINNNGYNNKIENLVWVTACQHSAIHSGLMKLELKGK